MSFWTNLYLHRPGDPPRITGRDLTAFIQHFAQLNVARPTPMFPSTVKFGLAIDQDDRPSDWEEPDPEFPGLAMVRELEWDVETKGKRLDDLYAALQDDCRPIYRALISLGGVSDHVRNQIQRMRSPENQVDLLFFDWWLAIGPVVLSSLETEHLYHTGWISLGLGGPGYLYPWKPADLVRQAEGLLVNDQKGAAALQQVMRLCRDTWPVPPTAPSPQLRQARKGMGNLWPYPTVDMPLDWHWGVRETG